MFVVNNNVVVSISSYFTG